MPKEITTNGDTSRIERVFLPDSSSTTGAGLTGLDNTSSGLIISTIADNEATATAYTTAASNVETIATLGTYAAPTASKCRFKEVDATNHPGLYEIQLADARYAVSNAEKLIITISGATNLAPTFMEIQLAKLDVYDSVRAGLTALPNAAADAAGGLPISDAGGLDLDTKLANTNEITVARMGALTDWIDENEEQEFNNAADEDRYYYTLRDSYDVKNAPFDSVKGTLGQTKAVPCSRMTSWLCKKCDTDRIARSSFVTYTAAAEPVLTCSMSLSHSALWSSFPLATSWKTTTFRWPSARAFLRSVFS